MASLKPLEKIQFEDLFGMRDGYVMGKDIFSTTSFSEFFRTTAGVDIFDNKYELASGSKANRLRAFWQIESDALVGKVLHEMLLIWEYHNDSASNSKALAACKDAVKRLLGKAEKQESTEDDFLKKDFSGISIKSLSIEHSLISILESRIKESAICLRNGAPLASVILTGSVLEGLLLGVALSHMKEFNQATASPKDRNGNVLPFDKWNLASLIDTAHEIGILKLDVKKFSSSLREFRNFIHPYEHRTAKFSPDTHTAEICLQVLNAAIADISGSR